MKDAEWDKLLGQALSSEAEPDECLNQSIIHQIKERGHLKRKAGKRFAGGLIAAAMVVALSVTAYAATQLYSSKEIAESFGEQLLANAFDSENAIEVNQTLASGDYVFTLYGIVSGAGLREFDDFSEEVKPERTYAVLAVARQDGNPMPDGSDPNDGRDSFFISPLIKGLKPWLVNFATMKGGYSERVKDGILYRIIACDGIEMFADRSVYLAISSGSPFYNSEAFQFDEKTGEIRVKENYPGSSVLFDLPLDPANADREKAELYMKQLLDPPIEGDSTAAEDEMGRFITVRQKLRNGEAVGEIIPDSVREVSYTDSGNMLYSYDDWHVVVSEGEYFIEGQVGFADRFTINGNGDSYKLLRFHRDEHGTITGSITLLNAE